MRKFHKSPVGFCFGVYFGVLSFFFLKSIEGNKILISLLRNKTLQGSFDTYIGRGVWTHSIVA